MYNICQEHKRQSRLDRHKKKRLLRKGKSHRGFSGQQYDAYIERIIGHFCRVNNIPYSQPTSRWSLFSKMNWLNPLGIYPF